MNVGYKWTKGNDDKYYIIELIYNESLTGEDECSKFSFFGIPFFEGAYFTMLCVIKSIYEAETEIHVDEISGKAYYPYTYKVGQRIVNEQIFFYKEKEKAIKEIKMRLSIERYRKAKQNRKGL